MNNIKDKLEEIIETRASQLNKLETQAGEWKSKDDAVSEAIKVMEEAERVNSELAGMTSKLRSVADKIHVYQANIAKVQTRFSRNTLCIGIGGAARMGKSTFLQSVTGLDETQIPTSDKYFTTAIRSQIEHSPHENIAIADFHSVESFLRKIIAPLCSAIQISAPMSLADFRSTKFEIPADIRHSQEADDVLKRLVDAQKHLDSYEQYLTGERGVRIPLEKLRPFVAYPDGGTVKAGPYLAVSDLVIRVKFPSTDVSRLRVVDLPGLGEAGVDLAKVQTDGMSDVCDVTFLVKRPTDTNIQWTVTDSNALDAMSEAVPLIDDQTKYTAILANVGGGDEERAKLCVAAIRDAIKRPFEIIECNAINRDLVIRETMPRILDFLARNLPVIDSALIDRLKKDGNAILVAAHREIEEMSMRLRAIAPIGMGDFDFAQTISGHTMEVLAALERQIKEGADDGNDKEWDNEVERIHQVVDKWINDGCGYGSSMAFLDVIRKEITLNIGQPIKVINECRVKFRAQWEAMDLHLDARIAKLLSEIMDTLKGVLHGFVPERIQTGDALKDVRNQMIEFADRIDARHSDLGDEEALHELSVPLRRIADFELQFRFHLEPMLHAMTHLLISKELPQVADPNDAESFCEALKKKLLDASREYSLAMCKSGTGKGEFEKKKRLLERAISDASTRADVVALLEQSASSAQSFCPKRIFAAVIETFDDAFIRSKDSGKAFQILAREWRNELTPAPDDKTRLTNAAAGALNDLVKRF